MSYITKDLSKIDSIHLVDYILYKGGEMSHLKIQKILFYIQAYHLAYFDKEIIEDDFEAWVHGPVSKKIYNTIKDISTLHTEIRFVLDDSEKNPEELLVEKLNPSQKELIDDVINELKSLSGLQLENMTHSESPWINARKGLRPEDKSNNIISKESMKVYYKDLIYG